MNDIKIVDNGVIKYTSHEINSFKNGKVKIVYNESNIIMFVKESIKFSSNAKLYFGKINNNVANKIKTVLDINVEN